MGEPWYQKIIDEIEALKIRYPRRMNEWDRNFWTTVKPRMEAGLFLSEKQNKCLLSLYGKMTEPVRLKR